MSGVTRRRDEISASEPVTAQARGRRWQDEAEFFDRKAVGAGVRLQLDPIATRRYGRKPLRNRFSPEFRFGLVRPLEGRRALDVSCGDGVNTVLLAGFGANVAGLALSQSPRTSRAGGPSALDSVTASLLSRHPSRPRSRRTTASAPFGEMASSTTCSTISRW